MLACIIVCARRGFCCRCIAMSCSSRTLCRSAYAGISVSESVECCLCLLWFSIVVYLPSSGTRSWNLRRVDVHHPRFFSPAAHWGSHSRCSGFPRHSPLPQLSTTHSACPCVLRIAAKHLAVSSTVMVFSAATNTCTDEHNIALFPLPSSPSSAFAFIPVQTHTPPYECRLCSSRSSACHTRQHFHAHFVIHVLPSKLVTSDVKFCCPFVSIQLVLGADTSIAFDAQDASGSMMVPYWAFWPCTLFLAHHVAFWVCRM